MANSSITCTTDLNQGENENDIDITSSESTTVVVTSEPSSDSCCVIDVSDDEILYETTVKRKRNRHPSPDDAELIDLTSASPGTSDSIKKCRRIDPVIEVPAPQLPPPPVGPRCPVCLEPFENVSCSQPARRNRFSSKLMSSYFFPLQAGKASEPRKIVSTKCGHLFCETCLKESLKLSKTCPKCRIKIGPRMFHPVFL